MAVSMASLGALPVISCTFSCSSRSAVKLSSSANMVGMRLNSATAAAEPSFPRSSRSLVVRADDKPSVGETITSVFGDAKEKASEVTAQGEKELNKTASEAKSASKDLGGNVENLKDEAQAKAEEAAEGVKTGIADLKAKVEEAVDAAESK